MKIAYQTSLNAKIFSCIRNIQTVWRF